MKFVADRTLGKLAKKLRVLGFDALYWKGGTLEGAAKDTFAGGRVLLTRSRRVPEKLEGLQVLVVEANDPKEQIQEVFSKLDLRHEAGLFFSRCLMCNQALLAIAKEEVEGRVPDFIYRSYHSFHICPSCHRIYWPGTHFQRMKKAIGDGQ
jgi:uncharacterized protein with PIN domain